MSRLGFHQSSFLGVPKLDLVREVSVFVPDCSHSSERSRFGSALAYPFTSANLDALM